MKDVDFQAKNAREKQDLSEQQMVKSTDALHLLRVGGAEKAKTGAKQFLTLW